METPYSHVHQDPALPQCNPFSGSSKNIFQAMGGSLDNARDLIAHEPSKPKGCTGGCKQKHVFVLFDEI